MEPVTMALVATVALAASTHRPKWEDQLLPELSSTVLVMPKQEATAVPLIDRRAGPVVGKPVNSVKQKLHQELMTFIPTGDEDPSLEPVSKVEEVLAANDFLQKLPGSIPLPTLQRNHEGHIGMYWDNDIVYIDVDIDSGSTMSLYVREQSTGKQSIIEDVQLEKINADWLDAHIGQILNTAALA